MNTVIWLSKYLGALIQIIKVVESAIPGSGQGSEKIAMVRELLELTDNSLSEFWPTIEKIIAVLVKTFNATGLFKTSANAS